MNYYIKGDAANADRIKAAFEEKGIYSNFNFANENNLYYSCNRKVNFCFDDGGLSNIIKTHPDYQELELTVEPKFKVGDRIRWIDVQEQTITDIKDGSYITVDKYGIRCALKFAKQDEWELVPQTPHYDIKNFKPFDKVLVRESNERNWVIDFYGFVDEDIFICTGCGYYSQCIPFDGNEHLLGTTDMPSEEYINW